MKRVILILTLICTSTAFAQQGPPDPAFLQKAITALQQQRNSVMDQLAATQAQFEMTKDELAKVQAHVKELEDKIPKPDEKK